MCLESFELSKSFHRLADVPEAIAAELLHSYELHEIENAQAAAEACLS